MKILLISGATPVPAPLRDVISKGSTSLVECAADDPPSGEARLDADRVVFWAAAGDAAVRDQARRYARATPDAREDRIVYVTGEDGGAPEGLTPNEIFVWPADEDRLKMAFMTSA